MNIRKLLKAFACAFNGILVGIKTQTNMRIHVLAALIALGFSYYLQLNELELLFVLLAITLVFVSEMINTAIEATVDLVTAEFQPLAKKAKDVAAGAVLIAAFFAIIVAIVIIRNHFIGGS